MKYYLNQETQRIEVTEGNFLPDGAVEIAIGAGVTPADYNNDKNAGGNKYIIEDNIVKHRPLTPAEIAARTEAECKQRETAFRAEFIHTPLGWYRKVPRGFANALQSWQTINALAADGIDATEAQMIVFYSQPDFTNPEQCTDEWLIAHAYHPEPMSAQEWVQFHQAALLAWVQSEYGGNDFEKS